MMQNDIHIISRKGRWSVKKESNQRPTKIFDIQKDAIAFAKTKPNDRIIVHRTDGGVAKIIYPK